MINPFHAAGAVSVTDRLESVRGFNREQLQEALSVNGLQKTVELAIKRRLRALDKGSI
jgi:hypothetical protein